MELKHFFLLVISIFLIVNSLSAQENSQSCKVKLKNLVGTFTGECKNGFAHGNGDAVGVDHYIGSFKNGLPNGKGTYYYDDSTYHSGNFQDGIKEGKGETHHVRKGFPDSLIKGYWSADQYQGKKYTTYNFSGSQNFDRSEITPSDQNGNQITIEISTTSGSPNSGPYLGYVLTITNLISTDGTFIKKISDFATGNKSSLTYELNKFPAKLFATLSNGRTFELELYKAAKWTVRLFVNK